MAWYHIPGQEQDIVVSSQVCLSRNLAEFPFPSRLDAAQAREILTRAGTILEKNGFSRLDFSDISRTMAYALAEKQYIDAALIRASLPHALFLNEPCNLAVMVCGEDHILLQAIYAGLALHDGFNGVCKVEALFDAAFDLAFHRRLGYLTQNPMQVGTALTATVTLCLPCLSAAGRMDVRIRQLDRMGMTLRGLGDGETAAGCLFRLSNRATLGVTEEEIIHHVEDAARRLMNDERQAREAATGDTSDRMTDRAMRAEGILRHAFRLSATELVAYLGDMRCGVAMGVLPGIKVEMLNALLIESMPATLTLAAEQAPKDDRERERLRARMVRERLAADG